MRKRPVTVTTELSPELAEEFYEVVNKKFGGDIDEAVSEGIRLLISNVKPGLNASEACHRLALIEGQKEIKGESNRRGKKERKEKNHER